MVKIVCKEYICYGLRFQNYPAYSELRAVCLQMVSEPCTFMLCDCETLTFVTQK